MHPIIKASKCTDHPDYGASRSPTSDCSGCWRHYNLVHDLPEGNRIPKSRFNKVVRLSGRIPSMVALPFMDKPGSFFKRLREYMNRRGDSFVPVSMGIDASLRSSGVALIGYDKENSQWCTATFTDGMDLPQDASVVQKMNRQISIIESCVKAYRAFTSQVDDPVSIYIEDHAYSRAHTNNATEAHELHGVIKSQFYLLTGDPVQPVGIKSARAEVFCHGSPPGNTKKALIGAMKGALIEEEYQWVDGLTDDEVDAWTIASTHVKKHHPFGTFENN